MTSALIGATGFVGSTLLRQRSFDHQFHSRNIGELPGRAYSLVVCAGAPAQKWLANRDPDGDRERLASLIAALRALECEQFVLVSTVDVFKTPVGVNESVVPDASGLHAYGRHRLELEQVVQQRFPSALVVRLPGLVGPGLRKNAIFDLLHGNNVAALHPRSEFQFYPVVQLWTDISRAIAAGLSLVHLTAAPVSVGEVALECFGQRLASDTVGAAVAYDFRTLHAQLYGSRGDYQYSRRESLIAVRAYAQSEPVRRPAN